MMNMKKLHPKLSKNLLDVIHERYLQKSHTIVNIGLGIWLGFLGAMATYLIEGGGELNEKTVELILLGTSFIMSFTYFRYRMAKYKRFSILRRIKSLDKVANKL